MKIRLDFVTNSSSSSFTIIGRKVSLKEINLNNGKYIAAGKLLSDGVDIFELDDDMLKYIESNVVANTLINEPSSFDDIDFYRCFIKSYPDDDYDNETCFTLNELSESIQPDEKFQFIDFDKDNWSTNDLADLKDRYN